MFFLATTLKFQTDQALQNYIYPPRLLQQTMFASLLGEQYTSSIQAPLTIALLPLFPHHTLLRLTWKCDRATLANLTSWCTSLDMGLPLQIESHQGVLEAVQFYGTPWTGSRSWTDISTSQVSKHIRLTFATPMVSMASEKEGIIFPEPDFVFSNLYEQWHILNGPPLLATVEELISCTRCVLSAYRLTTVAIQDAPPMLRGYTGWIEFEYRIKQVKAIMALNTLASLAFYTGVGYYTDRGLGTTSVGWEK